MQRLKVRRAQAKAQLRERLSAGEELRARHVDPTEELKNLQRDHRRWSDVNAEILRHMFTTDHEVNRYHGPIGFVVGRDLSPDEQLEEEHELLDQHLERLRSLIERLPYIKEEKLWHRFALVPEFELPEVAQSAPVPESRTPPKKRPVFIVHGHDDAARESVARFLITLNFDPIILNEQPNKTRTIIEKFEQHAASAVFAIVILTPDDVGASADQRAHLKPRARQNVVLELGYFLGAWKRTRVCALYKPGVELPSDLQGIVYAELDDAGAWKLRVAQEMDAVGIEVDFNRLRARR